MTQHLTWTRALKALPRKKLNAPNAATKKRKERPYEHLPKIVSTLVPKLDNLSKEYLQRRSKHRAEFKVGRWGSAQTPSSLSDDRMIRSDKNSSTSLNALAAYHTYSSKDCVPLKSVETLVEYGG